MRLIITYLLTLLITLNFCLAQEKTQNATKLLNSVDAKQILQKAVEACLKITSTNQRKINKLCTIRTKASGITAEMVKGDV